MTHFLLLADPQGFVVEVLWSEPPELVALTTRSFPDTFVESDRILLREDMRTAMTLRSGFLSDTLYHLTNPSVDVRLFLFPSEDHLLVFAMEVEADGSCVTMQNHMEIVQRFLVALRERSGPQAFRNSESVRYQFERIQGLNNELVNTRRMLEKTNAQLNQVNADLNNRLVKDPLTGLISRYQYRAEIDLHISRNPGRFGIFTFMDIDGFKSVNDRFGHPIGDRYLVEFADRLRRMPLENTVRMRISGDEFGLFTFGLSEAGPNEARRIWDLIETCVLHEPILADGNRIPITVSAGMAVFGLDTRDIYLLIEYADAAMYEAKQQGKNRYRVYGHRVDEPMDSPSDSSPMVSPGDGHLQVPIGLGRIQEDLDQRIPVVS